MERKVWGRIDVFRAHGLYYFQVLSVGDIPGYPPGNFIFCERWFDGETVAEVAKRVKEKAYSLGVSEIAGLSALLN